MPFLTFFRDQLKLRPIFSLLMLLELATRKLIFVRAKIRKADRNIAILKQKR